MLKVERVYREDVDYETISMSIKMMLPLPALQNTQLRSKLDLLIQATDSSHLSIDYIILVKNIIIVKGACETFGLGTSSF